jgi:hypothetical protein
MDKLLLAVDPGKASGVALFSLVKNSDPVLIWSTEVQQDEYAKTIRSAFEYAAENKIRLDIVCERFTINAQTVRNSQSPYSLEQIGIMKQCIMDNGRPADDFHFQAPADAKAMFPNIALKKLKYWHKGGEGHALDAIRHGLLHFVKTGWHPVNLLSD